MALSKDRNTRQKFTAALIPWPVKASAKIYVGALVAIDSSGYAVPAGDTATHKVVGRSDGQPGSGTKAALADATGLASGAIKVNAMQGIFKWTNSSGQPIVAANVGGVCYVEDDHTVAASSNQSIVAGIVTEIDADGDVWVATLIGNSGAALVGPIPSGGAPEVVTSGAVSVVKRTSLLSIDGTKAFTLAAGTIVGQRKTIRAIIATNTPAGTITGTFKELNAAKTTAAFNAVDDFIELEWDGAAWACVFNTSVSFA